jgi:Cellulase (glycosyl hydrolase family 5)
MTIHARLALAALLAGGLLAVPAAASARGLATGILDPGQISHQSFVVDPPVAMNRTKGAGGKYVRIYLYWNAVVTSQSSTHQTDPGSYDWAGGSLQQNVDAAQNAGLQVMLTVRSAPAYAQRGKPDSRGTHDPSPTMLANFVKAATQHFNDVHLWGIWNEPNSPSFLTPQYKRGKLVSPTLYKNLLKAAAPAVYADPQNKIIAGETSPFGHKPPRGHNPGPLAFLRKLLCMSGRSSPRPTSCNPRLKADFWATHPYTSGSPWHHASSPDDVSFGDVPAWKKLVSRAVKAGHLRTRNGGKRVQYWLDEFSWDTKAPDPEGVPASLHARWTAEALYRSWTFGVGALFWGQLRDYPLRKAPYQSGLYYCDTTPKIDDPCTPNVNPQPKSAKPALRAFRFPFVAYASNGRIKIWGRTPDSNSHSVAIQRRTSSGWKRFASASADSNGIFRKAISSGLKKGSLRAHFGNESSQPFSLKRPKERFVNPFGCGGGIPC